MWVMQKRLKCFCLLAEFPCVLKGPHTMPCMSCLPHVFENRLVLDVAVPIDSHAICDGFCATAEDLSSGDRDVSPSQPNVFTGPSQKTFADHCSVLFLC